MNNNLSPRLKQNKLNLKMCTSLLFTGTEPNQSQCQDLFLTKKPTVGLAFVALALIKINNRDPIVFLKILKRYLLLKFSKKLLLGYGRVHVILTVNRL